MRRTHKGKQASCCQVCPTAFGPEETEVQASEVAPDSLYQAVPRPKKEDETRPFPKVKPEEVDAQEDEEEEEADPGSDVDFSGDDPSSGGDLQVSLSNSSCCVSWLKQERQFRPWLGRLKLSKRNSTK